MRNRLVFLAIVTALGGCSGGDDDDDDGGRTIESVSLSPETAVIASGSVMSFTVSMTLSDASTFAPNSPDFEIDGVGHDFGCMLSGGGTVEMTFGACGVFVFATNASLTLTARVDAGEPGEVSDTSAITVP